MIRPRKGFLTLANRFRRRTPLKILAGAQQGKLQLADDDTAYLVTAQTGSIAVSPGKCVNIPFRPFVRVSIYDEDPSRHGYGYLIHGAEFALINGISARAAPDGSAKPKSYRSRALAPAFRSVQPRIPQTCTGGFNPPRAHG